LCKATLVDGLRMSDALRVDPGLEVYDLADLELTDRAGMTFEGHAGRIGLVVHAVDNHTAEATDCAGHEGRLHRAAGRGLGAATAATAAPRHQGGGRNGEGPSGWGHVHRKNSSVKMRRCRGYVESGVAIY
jgi:hypothetical protein